MKILVVDDESNFVSLLIEALSPAHEVFGITGGADIVEWVRRAEVDLVLLDVVLPDSNGFALLSELKQHCSNVFVILMTGTVDPTTRDRALKAGADRFVTKPLNIPDLRNLIFNLGARTA